MKRGLAALLITVMLFALCSCADASKSVLSTDYLTVDGVYVDTLYREFSNPALRMVYLYYTVTAKNEPIALNSQVNMIFAGNQKYTSSIYVDVCRFAPNYYYSSHKPVEVLAGQSKKIAATFLVPDTALEDEALITLFSDSIPEIEKIVIDPNDIVYLSGDEAVCAAVDPEGYTEDIKKRAPADAATTDRVVNSLEDTVWELAQNSDGSKTMLRFGPGKFFVCSLELLENGGTYEVRAGYVYCTYSRSGYTVEIPYSFEGDKIKLHMELLHM